MQRSDKVEVHCAGVEVSSTLRSHLLHDIGAILLSSFEKNH